MRIAITPWLAAGWVAIIASAASLAACAPTLQTPDDSDAAPEPEGPVVHVDNGDGTTTTRVDARVGDAWVYLDLGSKREVAPAQPEASTDWDMAFQRFSIKLNGGVSGSAGVEIAALPGQDFDALTQAPDSGYVTDRPDTPADQGGDENDDPDYAFVTGESQWYDYDSTTHVLTPRDIVYVLRSAPGRYYKLAILSYYNQAGESGYISFRWREIADPPARSARP